MKSANLLRCALGLGLGLLFGGCGEKSKSIGPEPFIPEGGTVLYFADCDPFTEQHYVRDDVTLLPDLYDACQSDVPFRIQDVMDTARWRSNGFAVNPSSVKEGFHLVFTRSLADAATPAYFWVFFEGVTVAFEEHVEMPAGQTIARVERAETGTVAAPDTSRRVQLTVVDSFGVASLDVTSSARSFVFTGVQRTALCEFQIDLGLADGLGQPNGGVNFTYDHVTAAVTPTIFHDFTGGAHLDGTLMRFGPQYGIIYLAARSGSCHDTAAFYAIPPAQGYREDTLGTFATGYLVSDGNTVWFFDIRPLPQDSHAFGEFRLMYPNENVLFSRRVYDPTAVYRCAYDREADLLWVVASEGEYSVADSAWGYTTSGVLDSVIIADDIPSGSIYRRFWITPVAVNPYVRSVEAVTLNGASRLPFGTYPSELSEEFAGEAGVTFEGYARSDNWAINIFDDDEHWIARYPVLVGEHERIEYIDLLLADHDIIFGIHGCTNLPPCLPWVKVRILRSS